MSIDRDALLKSFSEGYALAYDKLGPEGIDAILERGRRWHLAPVLKNGGLLSFPHVHLADCGPFTAAVVHAQRVIGLDLGGDSVVGPTVQRALRSAEIEVSPSLKLADNGVAIAYVHAIYSPSPPSKSPLMRPEEASGLVMLLVRTDSLLSLSPRQTNLLDVSLTRQENTLSSDDVPVFQSKAHKTPGWLDTTLPRFERRELVETPYFPYELKVASQLRLSMADRLAGHADFFSIGTNDLTQYVLAMDRQHPDLAAEADSLHPAVLRLIKQTVEGARLHVYP